MVTEIKCLHMWSVVHVHCVWDIFLNWAKPIQNWGLQCSFTNYVESFNYTFWFLDYCQFQVGWVLYRDCFGGVPFFNCTPSKIVIVQPLKFLVVPLWRKKILRFHILAAHLKKMWGFKWLSVVIGILIRLAFLVAKC